jgi:hypothetical protein
LGNGNQAKSKVPGVEPARRAPGFVEVNDGHGEEKIEEESETGSVHFASATRIIRGLPRTVAARAMVSRDTNTLYPFQSEYSVHLMKR